LVSVISFWAFIAQGNQLTVAIAFTAIALFNMLRLPLNILPTFIVQILQAGVALDRISKFLDEEDVPDDVSSLKRVPNPNPKLDDERLGAVNATFRWNQPKQAPEGTDASKVVPPELANDIPEIDDDQRFQLSDISVIFPPGELTLITGPAFAWPYGMNLLINVP
jgi:ABC-type multidrug transport system fused ATPase/permease subunit